MLKEEEEELLPVCMIYCSFSPLVECGGLETRTMQSQQGGDGGDNGKRLSCTATSLRVLGDFED